MIWSRRFPARCPGADGIKLQDKSFDAFPTILRLRINDHRCRDAPPVHPHDDDQMLTLSRMHHDASLRFEGYQVIMVGRPILKIIPLSPQNAPLSFFTLEIICKINIYII